MGQSFYLPQQYCEIVILQVCLMYRNVELLTPETIRPPLQATVISI